MGTTSKGVFVASFLLLIATFATAQERNGGWPSSGRGRIATNAGGDAYFNGFTSWGDDGIEAPIRNGSPDTATGPLRIVLFYSSSIYPAGGSIVATTPTFGPLPPGGTTTVDLPWSINAPAGCFYWATIVQEDLGGGNWESDGYINYISPCSISPDHGPAGGGNTVTFTGRNLMRVTGVNFGTTAASIQSKSETSIAVTAPPHAPGEVVAKLFDGSGSSGMYYTYDAEPPQVSSLSPASGPAAGGNQVTISGSNLQTVTSVKFGTTSASIISKNATTIVVTAPPHAPGQVTVKVDGPGGTATKPYVYEAPVPAILQIDPAKGTTAGGETVTISGQNLADVDSVTFGAAVASIKSKSATKLVVTTPPNSAGKVNVRVESPAGSDTGKFTYEDPAGEKQLLPVVGSLAGNLGSFFRTSLQLHNPGDKPLTGQLLFHPQGTTASADPSLSYTIAPGETKFWNDILPAMNTSGLGSLDLQAAPGSVAPRSLVRIFNDGGTLGTTGMTIDFLSEGSVLGSGSSAVLVAPYDPAAFRFNIGIRALGSGASMNVVVRNANGAVTRTVPKQFAPGSFVQTSAASMAGGDLLANESVRFEITSGSAMIYGAATDNITQDPSYQLARRVPEFGNDKMVVAVAGSVAGNFSSFFRTAVQMHNPHAAPLRVRAVYHPQGSAGNASDPTATFTLAAGETKFFSDLVVTLGASGVGSVDLVPLDGLLPVVITRIYNDAGPKGTTGMTLDAYTAASALGSGQSAILVAPADPEHFRYNIGVRSINGPATIEFMLRAADGTVRKTVERTYGADYFVQVGSQDLFGESVGANGAIVVTMRSGAALVYGAATDNRTQDPNVQIAREQ